MNRNTTFRFIGSLIQEFPDLISNSREMASGNVLNWVNESLKVIDSMGNVVICIMNKKKTKFLESEVKNLCEEQKKAEQELRCTIDSIKYNCENDRKKIQQIDINQKKTMYQAKIENEKAISNSIASIRKEIKNLIDIYENEIKQIIDSKEDFKEEKKSLEEAKRLLLQQYNKSIDI